MRGNSRKYRIKSRYDNKLTWANQTRILKQNFQQLAAVIGQGLIAAILPVVKLLNSLISGFNKAAFAFRNFMYTLMGKKLEGSQGGITQDLGDTYEDLSDGMDTATSSAKALGKALSVLSFDELNQLQAADSVSGTLDDLGNSDLGTLGGYSNLVDNLNTTDVETPINAWAKRIRDAFLKHDWQGLGFEIADGLNHGLQKVYDAIKWDNVGPKIEAFTTAFTQSFNSLVGSFDWDLLGKTIGAGFNTVVNTLNGLIEGINWKNLGRKFADGINGTLDEVNWENFGNLIGNKFMISWDIFSGFVAHLDYSAVGTNFANLLNGIFDEVSFSGIARSLTNLINGGFTALSDFAKTFDWDGLRVNVTNGLNTAFRNMKWEEAGQSLNEFLLKLGDWMVETAKGVDWEAFGKGIGDFLSAIDWSKHLKNLFTVLKEIFGGIFKGLGDTSAGKLIEGIIAFKLGTKLLPFINAIAKFFTGTTATKTLSDAIGTLLRKAVKGGAESAGTGEVIGEAVGGTGFLGKLGKILPIIGKIGVGVAAFTATMKACRKTVNEGEEEWEDSAALISNLETVFKNMRDEGTLTETQFSNLSAKLSELERNGEEVNPILSEMEQAMIDNNVSAKGFTDASEGLSDSIDYLRERMAASTAETDKSKKSVDNFTVTVNSANYSKGENAVAGVARYISSMGSDTDKAKDSASQFGSTLNGLSFGNAERSLQLFDSKLIGTKGNMSSVKSESENASSRINAFNFNPANISLDNLAQHVGSVGFGELAQSADNAVWSINQSLANLDVDTLKEVGALNGILPWTSKTHINSGLGTLNNRYSFGGYAAGGFPETGEMFMARENGIPEMVGRIGRNAAVANNDQITEAIAAAVAPAVYNAVVSAMSSSGNRNGEYIQNSIYFDSEVLARAMSKAQSDRNYRYSTA